MFKWKSHPAVRVALRAAIEAMESRCLMSVAVPDGFDTVPYDELDVGVYGPGTKSDVYTSRLQLKNGVRYFIKATGTAVMSANGREIDAEFGQAKVTRAWEDTQPDGNDWGLALGHNGRPISKVRWGSFDEQHEYGTFFTGVGNKLVSRYQDDPSHDNSGSIHLAIFRELPKVSIALVQDGDEYEDTANPDNQGQPVQLKFAVTRAGDLSEELSVRYEVSDTDTVAEDYGEVSGTVTIDIGAASGELNISVNDDDVPEYDEELEVELVEDSLGQPTYTLAAPPSTGPSTTRAVGKIHDNDVKLRVIGTMGDMVPSTAGNNGLKHYVTPKQDGTEERDPVTVETNLPTPVDAEKFRASYEWAGDGETNNFGDQRWVFRDDAKRNSVRLTRIADNKQMDELIVWVVWATTTPQFPVAGQQPTLKYDNIRKSTFWDIEQRSYWDILPASIVDTRQDIPDMRGANTTLPPNAGASETSVYHHGGDLSGGANRKWDGSRQIRSRLTNPNNIDFSAAKYQTHVGFTYWKNFLDWPSNPLVGNDDAGNAGNSNDPYGQDFNATITIRDNPTPALFWAEGNVNDTVNLTVQWRDFCRLQIGDKWFKISDYSPWQAKMGFKKIDEALEGREYNVNGVAEKLWISTGASFLSNDSDF